MLNQFLPRRIDNTYHGQKIALWLFALLLLMKVAISLGSIFNGYEAASSADGIPLDTFTPAGAQAVVSLFALLGLSRLITGLVGILALVRYRAMIPLLLALHLLEELGRGLILQIPPIARTGTPPGSVIHVVLLALMIAGLALSLWTRGNLQAHPPDNSKPNEIA